MYRPNRIGPWPLVTLDTVPTAVSAATIEAEAAGIYLTDIGYWAIGAVGPALQNAGSIKLADQIDMPAGQQAAIGCKILGGSLIESGEYLVSCGGAFRCYGDGSGEIDVNAIIAKVQTSGLSVGDLTEWAYLPMEHKNHYGAQLSASCNVSVVLGDWLASGTENEKETFFGWLMSNPNVGVAEAMIGVAASVSLQRYGEDIATFDPNRG